MLPQRVRYNRNLFIGRSRYSAPTAKGAIVGSSDDGGLAAQLELSPRELVTLHALQQQMMRTDLGQDRGNVRKPKLEIVKRRHSEFLASMPPEDPLIAELNTAGAAEQLAGRIDKRSRAMILFIDLMTFNPWAPDYKWVAEARKKALDTAAEELAGITLEDAAAANKEFEALARQLRWDSINWGRIAALSAVGAVVGVATAGWAAPYIGGVIGASLGLTGAAATSAGLAALGGGSLAAGGFGIFGGTILVTGAGGVVAAGVAGVAAGLSPIGTAEIIADAMKLDLLAKLVLADAPDRDQKLRRVAEALQSRIDEYSEKINSLSDRIIRLTEEKRTLTDVNRELRDQITELKGERAEAYGVVATLGVVLDRLPATVS
jgi:hypothetical protein